MWWFLFTAMRHCESGGVTESPVAVLVDAFALKRRSVFALTVHGRLVEFILTGAAGNKLSSKSSSKDVFQEAPAVAEFVVAFHPDPEFGSLAVMPAGRFENSPHW
jgi:hypothetical protein